MDSKSNYKVIGLMSGTSLDGLDIAYCTFKYANAQWKHAIVHAETIPYTSAWRKKLSEAHLLSAEALIELDHAFGKFLGDKCNAFVKRNSIRGADFIASHGHTIFHQPRKGFTYQVGNGNAIHAITNLPVIFDFRSLDVARGGEGAPLVPAGDKFLFGSYDVCLNLGGIANLSIDVKRERKAFDVCFVNMGLNHLAAKAGKVYDASGDIASTGEINKQLQKKILQFYQRVRKPRPSLGRELFEKNIQPLLDDESISLADRLRTVTETAAEEIVSAILTYKYKNNLTVLCTGGGAFNSFLIARMLDLGGDDIQFILPEDDVIKFKEALVFAFLGVLRSRDEINTLKSVTNASSNSSGGVLVGL